MSRAERNKRLKKTKKGVDENQLVPEGVDPNQRSYMCTHGWKKRKSRSEGSRSRQHIRLTNCPFRFAVLWNIVRGELQVKSGLFSHNHQVSPAAFATYPKSRGEFDPLLLTFMGMNESGEGAVVQNCLIEANEDWHMERAISHLKRFHPTRVNFVRVIVVDKDLNAIRVLEANFPEARILICHFHMIKYLKEMRYESEFGKISSDDESQIDAAVHKMEYAVSEGKYNEAHEFMKDICERSSMDQFVKYFEKNWHSGMERWVYYLRTSLPHFNPEGRG
ncbi:hypothetical protein L915_14633 [Phytophthora nicotianae]|uniref:ZSWIM1/3 RNaseH-like domain-containing protein n=1 Tax=Phytophthora nicotianae TaxID=4792 RepID=W2GBF0_PHYNI|nr:hypothetical protein L915_14633 [Phytophthora nicotianae]